MIIKYLLLSLWTKQDKIKTYCDSKDLNSKNVQDNTKNVQLKPLKTFSKGTEKTFSDWSTDGNKKAPNMGVNSLNFQFDYTEFKGIIKEVQDKKLRLKILYYYLKDQTKNGIFKKPRNSIIGNYFGCKQDTIRLLFNELKALGYIGQVNELELVRELKDLKDYYKITKEWEQ